MKIFPDVWATSPFLGGGECHFFVVILIFRTLHTGLSTNCFRSLTTTANIVSLVVVRMLIIISILLSKLDLNSTQALIPPVAGRGLRIAVFQALISWARAPSLPHALTSACVLPAPRSFSVCPCHGDPRLNLLGSHEQVFLAPVHHVVKPP